MKIVQQIANSIDDMITMTIDYPSKYDDNKVPMLDIKAWMNEHNEVYYEFYGKPTKNPHVISKNSAMSIAKKIDFLSQGVLRRLHNTKKEIDWERKAEIIEKFMTEVKASGYNKRDRFEIVNSGVSRYNRLIEMEEKGIRPFYRPRNFQRKGREKEKQSKKGNWFKKKGNHFKSVFFVPQTPGSVLMKSLKKVEEKYIISERKRIKFVETSRRKYVDYFKNPNPFQKTCDPSEKCLVCKPYEYSS